MNLILVWIFATDRQTDGRTDGHKVMHMSPPCKLHRWAQKKETFRPETGPEFPQNDKNLKLCKKRLKNYFACFGAESFFLWALWACDGARCQELQPFLLVRTTRKNVNKHSFNFPQEIGHPRSTIKRVTTCSICLETLALNSTDQFTFISIDTFFMIWGYRDKLTKLVAEF